MLSPRQVGLFSLFSFTWLFGQSYSVNDSLVFVLNNTRQDTVKVQVLNSLIDEICLSDPKQAMVYSQQMAELSEKLKYNQGIGDAYAWMGYLEQQFGSIQLGEKYNLQAIGIYESNGFLAEAAVCYNNLAVVYTDLGKDNKAIYYYMKSMELKMEMGDTMAVPITLNNIGIIYRSQGKLRKAMELFYRSLFIAEKVNNLEAVAISLDNIANVYLETKHYTESLENEIKALEISRRLNDKYSMAYVLDHIGDIWKAKRNYHVALFYYTETKKLKEELNDLKGLGFLQIDMGDIYLLQNKKELALENYNLAIKNFDLASNLEGKSQAKYRLGKYHLANGNPSAALQELKISYELAKELRYPIMIQNSAFWLSEACEKNGLGMDAVMYYEEYIAVSDSLTITQNTKSITDQKLEFGFEKEKFLKEQEEKERERLAKLEVKRRNNLQYIFIFLLVVLFIGLAISLGAIKVSSRMADVIILLSLLIFFEFVLVISDPFVDKITSGVPIYKLLVNTLLAFFIFPLHSFLAKRLKKRTIKKMNG